MTAVWGKEDAQMLASLAVKLRPPHARQWKPEAVMAVLTNLRGRSLGSVICATTRCAMDRNVNRPEAIASAGSHWGDTMIATDWVPNSIPAEARCSVCSMTEPACRIRWHADHEFRSAAMAAKEAAGADPEAVAGAVAALKDEVTATPDRAPAPQGLEALADRDPELRARVDALRERNAGLAETPEQESAQRETEPTVAVAVGVTREETT